MSKSTKFLFLWIPPLVFLGLFYFYPLGSILRISWSRYETGAISSFLDSIQSTSLQKVVWFTTWQAAISTLLTLIIGMPGAYLLARYNFRGKSLFRAITSIPFIMPTLVVAASFNALLGPKGWINVVLMDFFNLSSPPINFLNSITAILVAHVFYNTTIVLRMVGDFWSHIDLRLGQAAQALGANRWQVFRKITLPLLMPVITAAALLIFIFDFSSFGVILVLGGPRFTTLEVEIYYQTISLFNLPLAAVLSVIQLVCTLLLTVTYTRLSTRLSKPLTLKSRSINQKRITTWRGRIYAGLVIGLLLIILTAPLFALAGQSIYSLESRRDREGEVNRGFTLEFYRQLGVNQQDSFIYTLPTTSIAISLGYAAATVGLALLLGIPTAWALARDQNSRINRMLDPVLMLPLGTSAVTLGLGFIVALRNPLLDFRASPLLVPIAHTLVAFPFVVRSLAPALKSIQPRLRQAASILGASPRQVIRHIDIPLIGRAILVASAFAFTISIGEFGATSLISRPEYPTVPVVIYRFLSRPGGLNYGQALALSTILMGITIVCTLAIEKFRVSDVGEF